MVAVTEPAHTHTQANIHQSTHQRNYRDSQLNLFLSRNLTMIGRICIDGNQKWVLVTANGFLHGFCELSNSNE